MLCVSQKSHIFSRGLLLYCRIRNSFSRGFRCFLPIHVYFYDSIIDIRTISDIVGPVQTSTTLNIYAHVMTSAKKKAAQKSGGAISNLGDKSDSKNDEITR